MFDNTVIDLSKLPIPKVIEELDYEQLFQEYLQDFTSRDKDYDALVESDPAIIVLETMAYRELLLRKRINEAVKASLLAFATGSDLDQIVAEYGVERLDNEKDDRLRLRGQMAMDGFSTAGPIGAYRYFALSASVKVKSVDVRSDDPGEVTVTILSTDGDGTAIRRSKQENVKLSITDNSAVLPGKKVSDLIVKSESGSETYIENVDYTFDAASSRLRRTVDSKIVSNSAILVSFESSDVLELVESKLNEEDVRPLTDKVTVISAEIIKYSISAKITVYPGPSFSVVEAAANDALNKYVSERQALAELVAISGIYQALHVQGVKNVELIEPKENIQASKTQAAYCEKINLIMEIFNE